MSPIDRALADWSPSAGWRSILEPAVAALSADSDDGMAWAQIAMCLGDTRQPALCFVVCLFARRLGQPDEADGRLSAHMALASADLGGVAPEGIDDWLATQLSETDNPRFVAERVLARCRALIADWAEDSTSAR